MSPFTSKIFKGKSIFYINIYLNNFHTVPNKKIQLK